MHSVFCTIYLMFHIPGSYRAQVIRLHSLGHILFSLLILYPRIFRILNNYSFPCLFSMPCTLRPVLFLPYSMPHTQHSVIRTLCPTRCSTICTLSTLSALCLHSLYIPCLYIWHSIYAPLPYSRPGLYPSPHSELLCSPYSVLYYDSL